MQDSLCDRCCSIRQSVDCALNAETIRWKGDMFVLLGFSFVIVVYFVTVGARYFLLVESC